MPVWVLKVSEGLTLTHWLTGRVQSRAGTWKDPYPVADCLQVVQIRLKGPGTQMSPPLPSELSAASDSSDLGL